MDRGGSGSMPKCHGSATLCFLELSPIFVCGPFSGWRSCCRFSGWRLGSWRTTSTRAIWAPPGATSAKAASEAASEWPRQAFCFLSRWNEMRWDGWIMSRQEKICLRIFYSLGRYQKDDKCLPACCGWALAEFVDEIYIWVCGWDLVEYVDERSERSWRRMSLEP